MLDRGISTSVSLPVGVYVRLRERAQREQRSLASVVREVIQRGLDVSRETGGEQRDGKTEQA